MRTIVRIGFVAAAFVSFVLLDQISQDVFQQTFSSCASPVIFSSAVSLNKVPNYEQHHISSDNNADQQDSVPKKSSVRTQQLLQSVQLHDAYSGEQVPGGRAADPTNNDDILARDVHNLRNGGEVQGASSFLSAKNRKFEIPGFSLKNATAAIGKTLLDKVEDFITSEEEKEKHREEEKRKLNGVEEENGTNDDGSPKVSAEAAPTGSFDTKTLEVFLSMLKEESDTSIRHFLDEVQLDDQMKAQVMNFVQKRREAQPIDLDDLEKLAASLPVVRLSNVYFNKLVDEKRLDKDTIKKVINELPSHLRQYLPAKAVDSLNPKEWYDMGLDLIKVAFQKAKESAKEEFAKYLEELKEKQGLNIFKKKDTEEEEQKKKEMEEEEKKKKEMEEEDKKKKELEAAAEKARLEAARAPSKPITEQPHASKTSSAHSSFLHYGVCTLMAVASLAFFL